MTEEQTRASIVTYIRSLAEEYKKVPSHSSALQASTLFDVAIDIEKQYDLSS
jgi:hypothetical protein